MELFKTFRQLVERRVAWACILEYTEYIINPMENENGNRNLVSIFLQQHHQLPKSIEIVVTHSEKTDHSQYFFQN